MILFWLNWSQSSSGIRLQASGNEVIRKSPKLLGSKSEKLKRSSDMNSITIAHGLEVVIVTDEASVVPGCVGGGGTSRYEVLVPELHRIRAQHHLVAWRGRSRGYTGCNCNLHGVKQQRARRQRPGHSIDGLALCQL